jgi:uncharacterized membrane protein
MIKAARRHGWVDLGRGMRRMTWLEKMETALITLAVGLIGSLLGGGVWLIRRVFTNEQQIIMLKREIESRDRLRREDREALDEVRKDVRDMRNEVRQLFRREG